jgi:hypothetical protein
MEQLEFWHTLTEHAVITNDDALHALLLYLDGRDESADYEGRVRALRQRGLLHAGFDGPPGQAFRRGTLAVALVRAIGLKGGLTMRLLGPEPRLAIRELEFRRLLPTSSPNQVISGKQLVGVLVRAGEYRKFGEAGGAVGAQVAGPAVEADHVAEGDSEPPDALWALDKRELSLDRPILAGMLQAPTTTRLRGEDRTFTAKVREVVGPARWRPEDSAAWRETRVGDVMSQNATVHTGAGSRVTLDIEAGQVAVIYQLTKVQLVRIGREQRVVKTDIGVPHGTVQFEIYQAGERYDAKVRGPGTTLAVQGTRVILREEPPFAPEAVSLVGRAELKPREAPFGVAVGSRRGGARVVRGATGAAETALGESVVDPNFPFARTQAESALIANLVSRGATASFDQTAGVPVLRGGAVPQRFAPIAALTPGRLNFVITWDSPADLNITVANQGGDEFLMPAGGFDRSSSGGRVPFDHRGGNRGGIEFAFWPDAGFPTGVYSVSALPVTGRTNVSIRAILDGRPVRIFPDVDDGDPFVLRRPIGPGTERSVEFRVAPAAPPARNRASNTPAGTGAQRRR